MKRKYVIGMILCLAAVGAYVVFASGDGALSTEACPLITITLNKGAEIVRFFDIPGASVELIYGSGAGYIVKYPTGEIKEQAYVVRGIKSIKVEYHPDQF